MSSGIKARNLVLIVFALSLPLAGCLSGDDADEPASVDNSGGAGAPTANAPPSISGSPPPAVMVGQQYSFVPTASDPDGDALTFSISNKPSWASFNVSTGALSGTAELGTEGTYDQIKITVSDGKASSSLSSFSIEVTQVALGSATLNWTAPSQNTDGSALIDLVGYKLYYGTNSGTYTKQIQINSVGVTTYVVENLVPDTYYFAATAVNGSGIESSFSNEAEKIVE